MPRKSKPKRSMPKGKLPIQRVPRPVNYRSRSAYMNTTETYKFFIDPKVSTDNSTTPPTVTQHPVAIDFMLNSPYTFKTGYKLATSDAVVNSEPAITEFTGSNGDTCTIVPGLHEDASRPGGDRSASYIGCKYSNGMITGAKIDFQFTPTQSANVKTQPGYCGTIRHSSNNFGGISDAKGNFSQISSLPFVQWRRVRGPLTNTLADLPGSVGASDVLSRSVRLSVKHSVKRWNTVADLSDAKDKFAFQLNAPNEGSIPTELDHCTWFLIPELQKETLGGVALQAPSGILTVKIRKHIRLSEPLDGAEALDTANLPPVYESRSLQSMTKMALQAGLSASRYFAPRRGHRRAIRM